MFKVTVDSTAYFDRAEVRKLGITVVPMTFTVGERRFIETYSGEQQERILEIDKKLDICKTSQPNYSMLVSYFKQLLSENPGGVLCITISSRLSGAFGSAASAAAAVDSEKIVVFDSLSIAGGEKFLAHAATLMSKEGKSIQETIEVLTEMRGRIKVMFSVSDMDALRRSGRVGVVKQSITNILNIVPLLTIKNGAVESVASTRGLNNFLKRVKKHIPKNIEKIIVMTFDDDKAKIIKDSLMRDFPMLKDIEFLKAGPILAIHLGRKSFGLAWMA